MNKEITVTCSGQEIFRDRKEPNMDLKEKVGFGRSGMAGWVRACTLTSLQIIFIRQNSLLVMALDTFGGTSAITISSKK